MPPKHEIQFFELYAQYAAKCLVFGVDIDETKGYLSATKNKWKLIAQYLFLTLTQLMVLFCLYRNYKMYQSPIVSDNLGWVILYTILTIVHSIYLTFFAIFAMSKIEMTNLWNQLLHYSRNGKFYNIYIAKHTRTVPQI